MRIETQRLILRHPEIQDAKDYYAFYNSDFVLRYNAMVPRSLEAIRKTFSQPDPNTLLLECKQTGKVIGTICLEEDSIRWGVHSRELSYFLDESHSRQGYMKEALGALIGYLFETDNIECVAARCFAPNTASLALLRSLGFHQDGYIPRCVKGFNGEVFDDTLHSLFRKDYYANR